MQETLLLNSGFTAIGIISWKKAITLLTLNKVEVVESYDKELRSTYLIFKMPAVVRLLNTFKKRSRPLNFSRVNIYIRDKYRCGYCGKKKGLNNLTFDHVIPKSQGGKTSWDNIVTCCSPCNNKKANRTPQQAGMSLLREPAKPNWLPGIVIRVNKESLPDAWIDYLYWTGILEVDSD
jgi:5-methylcytosine-specific restriction endonuclease McrA